MSSWVSPEAKNDRALYSGNDILGVRICAGTDRVDNGKAKGNGVQPFRKSPPQTLTALEIMFLSDVTKPEIESALKTLHELGALLSDNGDSRVEVTNAAVELLGDILREAAKTNK
ncbi:MAG: hypothetical protein ACLR06_08950 [Christensenellaceae bacterium]